jgi:hypothetical protein
MPLLSMAKSLELSRVLVAASSVSGFPRVLSNSSSFSFIHPIAVRLTGEFTSLEEPTDDLDAVILSVLFADGPDFIGPERLDEPEGPM